MGRTLSIAEAASALHSAGWPAAMVPQMIAIGMAESGLRVDAINTSNRNGSVDRGWLQINSIHNYDASRLLSDPVYTANAGLNIWKGQGLRAWAVYNKGLAGPDKVASINATLTANAPPRPKGVPANAVWNPNAKNGDGSRGAWEWVESPDKLAPQVKDPIGDAITGAGKVAIAPVKGVADVVAALADRGTWVRVLEVVAGLGLVVAGVVLLQKGTVTAAAKAVKGAVPGAVAGAAVSKAPAAVAGAL